MSGSLQWLFLTCLGLTFFVKTSLGQYLQPAGVLDDRITLTLQDITARGLITRFDADRLLRSLSQLVYSGAVSSYEADRLLRNLIAMAHGRISISDTDQMLEALTGIANNGMQHSVLSEVNYSSSNVMQLMPPAAPTAPVVLDERITATLQDFVANGLMQSWDADRILNALSKITYSGAVSTYDADRMLRHLVSTANGPVTSYDTDRILEALYSIENNGVQHSVLAPDYVEHLAAKYNFVRPWYYKFFGALSNLVRAGYQGTKYVAEHLDDHADHLK